MLKYSGSQTFSHQPLNWHELDHRPPFDTILSKGFWLLDVEGMLTESLWNVYVGLTLNKLQWSASM